MTTVLNVLRFAFVVTIGAALGVFVLQNLDPMQIDFLAWRLEAPRAMGVLVSVVLGVLVGVVLRFRPRARRER